MASTCASASGERVGSDAQYNATEVFERYQDAPKEDRDRLKICWGFADCGDCHRSEGHCGWCGIVCTPKHTLSATFRVQNLGGINSTFVRPLGYCFEIVVCFHCESSNT